jgi:undecaprenyl-diphosphatase
LLAAALLGMVQGLTEFLPVSSSAHLILARAFFGWDAGVFGSAFDVACHVGTLAAVVVFFWRDLVDLVRAVPAAVRGPAHPAGRRLWLIGVGTVPIVIVGTILADWIETTARTPAVAATALAAGAVLLLVIERLGTAGQDERVLSLGGAGVIGVAQAAALVPGVSRSGATIAAGMALGMRREVAARFTFLLSVPAIVAAAAKKGLELRSLPVDAEVVALFLVGMVTSGLVGYATVKFFIRFLATHRLEVFAWYRLALASVTFVWLVVP